MVSAIPGRAYLMRRRRVRAAMVERGLQALVVFGTPSASAVYTGSHGHLRYLADWSDRFSPSMLLLPAEGRPTLIVPSGLSVRAARAATALADVRAESAGNFGRLAARWIGEQGLAPAEVGLVGGGEMPYPMRRDLEGALGGRELPSADDILTELRKVKGPEELAIIRAAAHLSDLMHAAFLRESRRPGAWCYRVQAAMEHAAKREGAELTTAWFASGRAADRERSMPWDNRVRIRAGDQLLSGTYVVLRGYLGHAIRMAVKGRPTAVQERLYAAAFEAQAAAIAKIRPGADAAGVNAAAEEVLFRHFPAARTTPDRFRVGHALGLDYAEPPVSAAFPQPASWSAFPPPAPAPARLESGMVLEIHPNFFLPGVGGAAVGDMVLVTRSGADVLTKFPRRLHRV
jgi:Xaa-Pro aminopeptidase